MTAPNKPEITIECLQGWAKLTGLEFDDQKLARFQQRLNGWLNEVHKLRELPLDDIEPATIFKASSKESNE